MSVPTLTDPEFASRKHGALDRFFLGFIRDERDLPFVWLSLQITFGLLPLAAAAFVFERLGLFRVWMMPIYWAVLFLVFFDRYILMLHNTSHRPLWKREYNFLRHYIPWLLGPFCGETPETYYVHHITMHHAEGNLPKDLSSTMKYQRDSAFHFALYFLDFFFIAMFKLGRYQQVRGRSKLVRLMLVGEVGFYVVVALLTWVSPWAALTVFVVPFLLCRFLMMCGNWGQHAFVDGNDPGNSYRNSITCINTRYNKRCFNDGYHIGHHVTANRHWTDMPQDFRDSRDQYVANDSIIFEGLDFFQVWFLLMCGSYKTLAKHFVDLRDNKRSQEEIITLLRSRTQQIDCTQANVLSAVPV